MKSEDFFPLTLLRDVRELVVGILPLGEKWARVTASGKIGGLLDLLGQNAAEIAADWRQIAAARPSEPIPPTNRFAAPGAIFLEKGAVVEHAYLNASEGPIYIGRNALVMEGAMIRGPFALGEGAVVKMGATIYGATTIGAHCTVGGEIKNTVMQPFSNKAHEGYLGDSLIGRFCNLGAGTSNSNLRNTASPVKWWNWAKGGYEPGPLKCGLILGDYSRAAVNTSFNTATVVGACANIFGKGMPPKFIPSFSWGFDPPEHYAFDKAVEHIANWKRLKNQTMDDAELRQLKELYDQYKYQA